MPAQQWEKTFRRQIKDNHGFGWNLIAQSGKTKLTRVHEDGTKSAKVLPIEWKATNSVQILNAVTRVRQLMESRNLSLAEAVRLDTAELAVPSSHSGVAEQGWSAVVQEYLKGKQGLRSSTLSDLRTRLNRLLVCLDQKPKPRDSRALLKLYAQLFFSDMESGGEGRRRNIQSIVAFLRYAVDRAGAHQCWLPPEKSFTAELIGVSATSTQARLTPPIKSPDLAALLDQMEADGRHDLRLATALISLFGLRPAELALLSVKEGRLYAGAVKRNTASLAQKPKPPRLCLPLDIEGREGEGMKALQLYASGLVKLPQSVLNEISKVEEKQSFKQVGHAYGQLLRRYAPWQNLVRSNPDTTIYSLRHSWAWRCHVCSAHPLHVRQASALMGHTPTVHMATYGQWVDEASLEAAVERYTEGLVTADY
ncbi:phage integrase family protein [Synechococcus sp. RS9915]|nr:phage integrase family protein [Synechococcus sp. RS9915]